MRVIGVVGKRGSGKGVFAEAARKLGIPVFEMSDVVVGRMLKTKILITNRSLRLFADRLREKFGAAFVARETMRRIAREAGRAKTIAVVGVRSPQEIAAFKRAFKDFVLVGIKAPLELRWKRIQTRKRPEDAENFKEFLWAERMEEKWGVGKALKMAKASLKNAGGRKAFEARARIVLRKLLENEVEME